MTHVVDLRAAPPRSRALLWYAVLAALIPLADALYTDEIWEDYFITFRYSRNLVDGKGLVYNDGERVHGFTSPLGVLLPAACYWATGESSYERSIWAFRLLSIIAFAAGGRFLVRCFAANPFAPSRPFIALLYALDAKSVAFSANGMETGLFLFFVAWGLYLFHEGGPRLALARGVCWAGLLWTRPDGCMFIAALGMAELVFGDPPCRRRILSLLSSALLCAGLYAPWFLWARHYYGSPVPHTLIAKAPTRIDLYLLDVLRNPGHFYYERALRIFAPIYFRDFDGWPEWVGWVSLALCAFATVYWLLPTGDRFGRGVSLAFTLVMLYSMTIMTFYPWYMPPLAVLASTTLVSALSHWAGRSERGEIPKLAICVGLGALAAGMATLTVLTTWEMKVQQQEVEMKTRFRIGSWLRTNARPGDRVYVECLGYIGYFSGLHMLDSPGLVSPEVVRLRRRAALGGSSGPPGDSSLAAYHYALPQYLQTEWVVARLDEAELMGTLPYFQEHYAPAVTFSCRERLDRIAFLPGRGFLNYDSRFIIFRRHD